MSKPATTLEFLDALKAAKGFTSDYRLYKFLGWKQTTVSNYRIGKSTMAPAQAIRVADELGLSREYVLACVERERASDAQVKQVWESIALRFRDAAASILLGLVAATVLTHPAEAATKNAVFAGDSAFTPVYIIRATRRWARRVRGWLTAGAAAVALAGCASLHPLVEYTHTSHVTQHFGAGQERACAPHCGFNALGAGVRIRPADGLTVDVLESYSVNRFDETHEMFTLRASWELSVP